MKISTSELPEKWYSNIEKSREKAKRLLNQIVAIDLNTSIIVGKLEDVSVDRLWRLKYPFCKLTLKNPEKYGINGKFESKLGEEQFCFVSKPQMIMSLEELSEKFPEIHEDVHVKIRRNAFG